MRSMNFLHRRFCVSLPILQNRSSRLMYRDFLNRNGAIFITLFTETFGLSLKREWRELGWRGLSRGRNRIPFSYRISIPHSMSLFLYPSLSYFQGLFPVFSHLLLSFSEYSRSPTLWGKSFSSLVLFFLFLSSLPLSPHGNTISPTIIIGCPLFKSALCWPVALFLLSQNTVLFPLPLNL